MNEKPFAEYTVLPVRKDIELSSPFIGTNVVSEDNYEESDSDSALDTLFGDMVTKFGDEGNDFDLDAVHRGPVSYTHLRAHETGRNLVCRLLLEKKKK